LTSLFTEDDPREQCVITQLYICGTCKKDGNENAQAGASGWFPADNAHNLSARLPPAVCTMQAAEIAALIVALQHTQTAEQLIITCVSKSLIDGLTKNLPVWEDCGWLGIQNRELIKKVAAELRICSGDTSF